MQEVEGRQAGARDLAGTTLVLLFFSLVLIPQESMEAATGKEAFISPLRPVLPKHLPRFAFGREHAPMKIPLVVNVFLINLDYNSNNVFTSLSASEFEDLLMKSMPSLQPSCMETGEKLHVSYDLWFHVAHVDAKFKSALEHAVKTSMTLQESKSKAGDAKGDVRTMEEGARQEEQEELLEYRVPIEGRVYQRLKEIYDTYAPAGGKRYKFDTDSDKKQPEEGSWFHRGGGAKSSEGENSVQSYTLFIANLDKLELAPEGLLDKLQGSMAGKKGSELRRAVGSQFVYRYFVDPEEELGADAFLCYDRFAFLDLNAGPTQFGSMRAGEGAVITTSIPRAWFSWGRELEASSPSRTWPLEARLASMVQSAVSHLFVPDVLLDELDGSEEVLVALMVLRDHRNFNPLEEGHAFSIDVKGIEEEVKRLALPDQTIHFVSGLHNLQEHERVAIAVEKATRTDTSHSHVNKKLVSNYKHYLDSKTLFLELERSGDYLTAGLLDAGHPLRHKFFEGKEEEAEEKEKNKAGGARKSARKRGISGGTRVLPVYVLSLQRPSAPLILDGEGGGEGTLAYSSRGVLVLQHGDVTQQSLFYEHEQLSLTATNPSKAILAGVCATLGAIAPPFSRYSQQHQRIVTNFLWSQGWSPFGPFASNLRLSQILVDHSIRNAVLWRLDAAIEKGQDTLALLDSFASRFLFDSLGERTETSSSHPNPDAAFASSSSSSPPPPSLAHSAAVRTLGELHGRLLELEEELSLAAQFLYRAHLQQAFFKADVILRQAHLLLDTTTSKLEQAQESLACCELQHGVLRRWELLPFLRVFLVCIIVASLVVMFILRDPQRRTRLVKHYASKLR
mmetsp:Transcript_42427/g.133643  ORF Transcript_42427/g.133643 Transcript_42427/m.133643 type:complete len:847 (-) Transcript_42427:38-2578(-)